MYKLTHLQLHDHIVESVISSTANEFTDMIFPWGRIKPLCFFFIVYTLRRCHKQILDMPFTNARKQITHMWKCSHKTHILALLFATSPSPPKLLVQSIHGLTLLHYPRLFTWMKEIRINHSWRLQSSYMGISHIKFNGAYYRADTVKSCPSPTERHISLNRYHWNKWDLVLTHRIVLLIENWFEVQTVFNCDKNESLLGKVLETKSEHHMMGEIHGPGFLSPLQQQLQI